MKKRRLVLVSLATVAMAAYACSSGETEGDKSNTNSGGSGSTLSGTESGAGGSIFAGTGGQTSSSGGMGGAETCAQTEGEATIISRPIDIIFVIDNSGSMSEEIEEVEEQINQNFVNIIEAADPPVDYRVILVSEFGAFSDNAMCVAAPLGGIADANNDGHCDTIGAAPVNTARFFHHAPDNDDPGVSSHNALCRLGEEFEKADKFGLQPGGYKDALRPDAYKFFVVITDDRPDNGSADGCGFGIYDDQNAIDAGDNPSNNGKRMACRWIRDMTNAGSDYIAQLGGIQPPPNTCANDADLDAYTDLNFTFHSIVSMGGYMVSGGNPYGLPHPPDAATAPVLSSTCTPGAQNPGIGYQWLSVQTDGYRYPTCGLDYTSMFQIMADGVLQGAAVPCEFEIPDPPDGETLDLETVVVEYTSGATMTTVNFLQVSGPGECDASSFYIENNRIILCPEACTVVQADDTAEINIKYGCELDELGQPK